jgi:hypothetical protein
MLSFPDPGGVGVSAHSLISLSYWELRPHALGCLSVRPCGSEISEPIILFPTHRGNELQPSHARFEIGAFGGRRISELAGDFSRDEMDSVGAGSRRLTRTTRYIPC